jgi:hypothetical protein
VGYGARTESLGYLTVMVKGRLPLGRMDAKDVNGRKTVRMPNDYSSTQVVIGRSMKGSLGYLTVLSERVLG